jgi:Uma2 family endonuclease
MSTTATSLILGGVSWGEYVVLARVVDRHHIRTTYLDGTLELVIPSPRPEQCKGRLDLIVRYLAVVFEVPLLGLGSTTFRHRRKNAGKEPDNCYYLGANAQRMNGRKRINLRVDSPPDLAIEVEITRSAELSLDTYARLGVPEVWRYNGRRLRISHLQPDGTYADRAKSLAFPRLKPAHVQQWMQRGDDMNDTEWLLQLPAWIQNDLTPRAEGQGGAS